MEESRKTVTELEKTLAALSERLLSGVATKYGRSSMQYSKAGGSNRRGGSRASQPTSPASTPVAAVASDPALPNEPVNGNNRSSNGSAPQPALS